MSVPHGGLYCGRLLAVGAREPVAHEFFLLCGGSYLGLHAPRASVLFWAASTRPRCGLYTTYEGRTLFTPTNTYASLKFILPLRQFAGPRMLQYSRKRLRTAAQHRAMAWFIQCSCMEKAKWSVDTGVALACTTRGHGPHV